MKEFRGVALPTPTDVPQPLSERQLLVLRAMVTAYVAGAAPVGSATISHLLPVALSSASIRNTMTELAELGMVEKPHRSAGRVPTEPGLRAFLDGVSPRQPGRFERRELAGSVREESPEALIRSAAHLLSQRTRQLGFVMPPRIDQLVLRHVSLVRLSSTRVLAVLVSETGRAWQRVIEDDASGGQAELDRIAIALNERVAGSTLSQVRIQLEQDVRELRSHARSVLEQAIWLGWRALSDDAEADAADPVIATWLALLDQPEFHDPERVRQLFGALETQETLLRILDEVVQQGGLRVSLGGELGEPELRELALVAAPYGPRGAPRGVLGVIGPSRMDYPRVMGLVDYFSHLVTERLGT